MQSVILAISGTLVCETAGIEIFLQVSWKGFHMLCHIFARMLSILFTLPVIRLHAHVRSHMCSEPACWVGFRLTGAEHPIPSWHSRCRAPSPLKEDKVTLVEAEEPW